MGPIRLRPMSNGLRVLIITTGLLFIAAYILIIFNVGVPIDVPPSKYQMPDLEGGPYWTIYIDNLSTIDDEMFTVWEGYEGDLMNTTDADFLIPAVNHTYRFTYVCNNSSFYLDISANEAYNGT